MLTNASTDAQLTQIVPTNRFDPVIISPVGWDGTNSPLWKLMDGINRRRDIRYPDGRQVYPGQSFKNLGDILAVPELSTNSPFLNLSSATQLQRGINDAVYEWLPQQVMGLLRTGEPRFVVYSYGQTLRPARNSLYQGSGRPFRLMCTNYQVTAEIATRTMLQVKGSPDPALASFDAETAKLEASRCLQCPEPCGCAGGCPLHNDIPRAMWHISRGEFVEAAEVYRETSNLPEICGRVCPQEKLCQGSCVVGKRDYPVFLGKLEYFVTDFERRTRGIPKPVLAPSTGKRVAVVGSGPAGLAVAEELLKRGHAITIFESLPMPGGVMRYCNMTNGGPVFVDAYVLFKALPQVRRYRTDELVRAMELLLKCNQRLVSSGLDESLVLQQTLVQIVGDGPAAPARRGA